MNDYTNLPPYMNICSMAKHLNLSRSRLYQLVDQGILLQPVYLLNNKRPVYTKEMAVRNIEVKNTNVGINGQIVMFYSMRNTSIQPKKIIKKSTNQKTNVSNDYADMIDALESLGLENITSSQVGSALKKCFPDTIPNSSSDETLIEIYRYLKRQNTEHKPRT